MLAVRIVVPEELDAVPVGKIIELRRRHKDEFDTFNRKSPLPPPISASIWPM